MSRRDPAIIQRALSHIPAQDRDTWLHMGMALKSGLGEDGFGLWDTWSRTADNYNASDARAVWRSIKPNGGISIATLFHAAKRHGFRLPASELKRGLAEGKPRKEKAPEKGQWTPLVPVPPEAPPPPMAHRKRGKPSCVWTYRDPKGGVLCHVARFDVIKSGKPGKIFLPLTYCRSRANGKAAWRWQALLTPRPLYNLDKLTAHTDAPVILAEGEKSADAAAILFPERVATTTLNGAQSAHCTDFSPLKGCSVWIFPDHDVPGRKYAQDVAKLLRGVAREVKLLHVPGHHPEGWDAHDALTEGWRPSMGYELQEPKPDQSLPAMSPGIAECFKVTESGVWYHPPGAPDDDLRLPTWICCSLEVAAVTRNAEGENWGRLVEFVDSEGRKHAWAMPMRLLQADGREYRAVLADMGLNIASSRKARELLTTYLQTAQPRARVRIVERTGWQGAAFVFPDETIGDTNGEPVLLQTVSSNRHAYRQSRTLEDWQSEVSRLCVGNSRLVFSVSSAFASMLLEIMGQENGGFNFRGHSSLGKTTLLRVASSVFGCGDLRGGYMQTWRNTGNGLEAIAALYNDTLLCLDEIKQVDPREAGEIAYMLANGSGKGRADRAGLAREKQIWRLLFLSSGELSLGDHLTTIGKSSYAGEEVRLADIPADTGAHGAFEALHGYPDGAVFSEALSQAARTYYGVAAREFLRRLMPAKATKLLAQDLCKGLDLLRDEFLAYYVPEGASGQVRRVAARFALVAFGGELATKLDITGWQQSEALSGTAACFVAWLEARGGAGNQELQRAVAQVRRFFELHGESRFSLWNPGGACPRCQGTGCLNHGYEDGVCGLCQGQGQLTAPDSTRPTINRAGFRRVNAKGETEFYVLPEAFKAELCAGQDWRFVAKQLIERGWLIPARNGRSTRSERLPGLGNTPCYRFTSKVLGEPD